MTNIISTQNTYSKKNDKPFWGYAIIENNILWSNLYLGTGTAESYLTTSSRTFKGAILNAILKREMFHYVDFEQVSIKPDGEIEFENEDALEDLFDSAITLEAYRSKDVQSEVYKVFMDLQTNTRDIIKKMKKDRCIQKVSLLPLVKAYLQRPRNLI